MRPLSCSLRPGASCLGSTRAGDDLDNPQTSWFAILALLLSQWDGRRGLPGSVVRTAMSLMHLPFHDTVEGALAWLRAC